MQQILRQTKEDEIFIGAQMLPMLSSHREEEEKLLISSQSPSYPHPHSLRPSKSVFFFIPLQAAMPHNNKFPPKS